MIVKDQILIFILLSVDFCVQATDFESGVPCGTQFIRKRRIVGGSNAVVGEVPWMASITLRGHHHCGAAIIDKRWIITASHCFVGSSKPENYLVIVGGFNLGDANEEMAVSMEVEKIYMHPNFANPERQSNDIALIKLKKDIVYNKDTWPICMDRGNVDLVDRLAIVAGWGKLKEGGALYLGPLQIVRLPIVQNPICQKWFNEIGKKWLVVEDSQICAGYEEGGKDACQQDSGGPQYVKANSTYILTGVVSAGFGCARPKSPGLFARVSSHLSWIDSTMKL